MNKKQEQLLELVKSDLNYEQTQTFVKSFLNMPKNEIIAFYKKDIKAFAEICIIISKFFPCYLNSASLLYENMLELNNVFFKDPQNYKKISSLMNELKTLSDDKILNFVSDKTSSQLTSLLKSKKIDYYKLLMSLCQNSLSAASITRTIIQYYTKFKNSIS